MTTSYQVILPQGLLLQLQEKTDTFCLPLEMSGSGEGGRRQVAGMLASAVLDAGNQ